MGRIVVGVDGSEHSRDALRWAAAQASTMHAELEAIICWHYPVLAADGFSGAVVPIDVEALKDNARQTLDRAIEAALPDDVSRAGIVRTVAEGSPGHVLVEASTGAELLVVGSRGHGGFAGLLLGSVGAHCVHHAHCPVTVIRPEKTA